MNALDRITHQPGVMGGKACVRGMRVTVGMIVGQIGAGRTVEELLAAYPYLEREDILQALRYAAWRAEEREVTRARVILVADMNLSPGWVATLESAGHTAVHWSTVGSPTASDAEIMAWAAGRDAVVLTHDLDVVRSTRPVSP